MKGLARHCPARPARQRTEQPHTCHNSSKAGPYRQAPPTRRDSVLPGSGDGRGNGLHRAGARAGRSGGGTAAAPRGGTRDTGSVIVVPTRDGTTAEELLFDHPPTLADLVCRAGTDACILAVAMTAPRLRIAAEQSTGEHLALERRNPGCRWYHGPFATSASRCTAVVTPEKCAAVRPYPWYRAGLTRSRPNRRILRVPTPQRGRFLQVQAPRSGSSPW